MDQAIRRRRCSLCSGGDVVAFAHVHAKDYFSCRTCNLVFVAPQHRPDPADEKAHYMSHENDPADERYRAFLNRLAEPLVRHLPPGACGLDYGSGPGPTLSVMLEEQGFKMENYDPFFAPDRSVAKRSYDFITCTETAEHFFEPGTEFTLLDGLLNPGGWLGVMTEVLVDGMEFAEWWYVRDPTHVSFYRRSTFEWIGDHFHWDLKFPRRNVVLFQKRAK